MDNSNFMSKVTGGSAVEVMIGGEWQPGTVRRLSPLGIGVELAGGMIVTVPVDGDGVRMLDPATAADSRWPGQPVTTPTGEAFDLGGSADSAAGDDTTEPGTLPPLAG